MVFSAFITYIRKIFSKLDYKRVVIPQESKVRGCLIASDQ